MTNASDAAMVVARVDGVPTAIGKDFGLGAQSKDSDQAAADVLEIASAIARGNVPAPAERYDEMRKIAARARSPARLPVRRAGDN